MKNGTKWIKQGDYKSTTRWVNIRNLNFNQKYTFTVRAYTKTASGTIWGDYDKTGASAVTALSEPKPEKPASVAKPAAPAVSAETAGRTSIRVSWKGVKGADGYRIYMKNGNKWVKQGDYKSTTRWVKVGTLKPNTKYTFTVRAFTKTDSGNVWGDYDKTGAAAVTAR